MARTYRLQAQDCFYHITSRGDDRKKVFVNETDYKKFLEYLLKAKEKFKFYLHCYCLMGNHYHLFIETPQPNLSRIMQYLNTAYTTYYNVKRSKSGHLFQGRYKSILVETDSYFAELSRYIHLNPVRAKIVIKPDEYIWSSYNAYTHSKNDKFVDINRVRQFLDMDLRQYREFVEKANDCPNPLKNVYAGFILGREDFIKNVFNQVKDEVESGDFAHKRALKNIINPQTIINAVADYFKISSNDLRYLNKRPMIAKKMALYLLRRKTGLTNCQIGEMFNMKFSAVSKAALSFEIKIINNSELNKALRLITSKVEA